MSNLAVIMRACEQFERSESNKRCIMDVRGVVAEEGGGVGQVNVAIRVLGASNKGSVGHVSDT